MKDKNGCMGCIYFGITAYTKNGKTTLPVSEKNRNKPACLELVKRQNEKTRILKCIADLWDGDRIGVDDWQSAEFAIFRRDRGKNCPLFIKYDPFALPPGAQMRDFIIMRNSEHNWTRIFAILALVISVASFCVSLLAFLFRR